MRTLFLLALVVAALSGCENNYSPPQPYGVGEGYGGAGGFAYASSSGSVQAVYIPDAEAEAGKGGDQDVVAMPDVAGEVSEAFIACWKEFFNSIEYCQCLEEGTDEYDCTCIHLVCVADPPDATFALNNISFCQTQGFFDGVCS